MLKLMAIVAPMFYQPKDVSVPAILVNSWNSAPMRNESLKDILIFNHVLVQVFFIVIALI